MADGPSNTVIRNQLDASGLVCFGVFKLRAGMFGLLIGNVGSEMWHAFSASSEYQDGLPDPMNRWTERVVGEIAEAESCDVIYPFSKPFLPFQQFAMEAMGIMSSPLGLLVHPTYGLWFAFRAALIIEQNHPLFHQLEELNQDVHKLIHPCDACLEKPCLSACPVSAFSDEGLSVGRCFAHLDGGSDPLCMEAGCAARLACPVGRSHQYLPSHMRFHMGHYRN